MSYDHEKKIEDYEIGANIYFFLTYIVAQPIDGKAKIDSMVTEGPWAVDFLSSTS